MAFDSTYSKADGPDQIRDAKERRILLLTGPPGSGKSATVNTLLKELNLTVREWGSFDSKKLDYQSEDGTNFNFKDFSSSQADRFFDFIFRSSRYKDILTSAESESNVILIEEIPNALIMNPLEFQQILRKYFTSCIAPIIFIISETNNNNLVRTLFPSEFQEELFITNIAFNPISTTLLTGALNRLLEAAGHANAALFDASRLGPKKQFVQAVAERSGGDVRSAVNSMQFALMKGDVGGKRKRSDASSSGLEGVIGCKDSSLVLFRALGKVLYCKRELTAASDNCRLPHHLRQHERNPALESPEEVFDRSDSDASTFNLFLHHNCLPFFGRIEDYAAALHYLGDSDVLDAFWEPSNQLKTYSASVTIRGMMHSVSGGPKTTPNVFRSLTCPSWFGLMQTLKERNYRIRKLTNTSTLTNLELSSTYVPLIAKIYLSTANEIDRFVRDVGLFYPPPVPSRGVNTSRDQLSTEKRLAEEFKDDDDDDEDFFIEEIED